MKATGCSLRCKVILAVTLSGIKLPVFVYGHSQIMREFMDPALGYPQSIIYCMQPKA